MPKLGGPLGEFRWQKFADEAEGTLEMSYVEPDREWVEIELKLMDEMGRKWFLRNPPKIWKLPKRPDDLVLESMKKKLGEAGFRFKTFSPFVNRYVRDLVSIRSKIVIHHWDVSADEKKIQRVFGFRFFTYRRNNWREGVERIIQELRHGENESVVR